MIKLEIIDPSNAAVFKEIRLRALQDSPITFSATHAEESKLTDSDRVDQRRVRGLFSDGHVSAWGSG